MTKKIIILSILVLVVIGAGYLIRRDYRNLAATAPAKIEKPVRENIATSTAPKTEKKVSPVISLNIPDFKKITIDPSITGTAKEKLTADIRAVITTLDGNVMNPAAWIQLGILRQSAKDYDGAVVAWNFSSTLSPQNATPLLNIANLYGYYRHDNAKAEGYFKKAIAAEPKNGYAYFKAYEFYTDINDLAKARAVLEQGVAANPGDAQLKAALDSLK